MEQLPHLRKLMQLKNVNRHGEVNGRAESSAEHSWGCVILAQYFLKFVSGLDELKVIKLLTYHDLVEIEAGDVFILGDRTNKEENEKKAFDRLLKQIPDELRKDYENMFHEYEQRESMEAKFAKAIDNLEAMIHWLDYKPAWKEQGFNEDNLRKMKEDSMKPFPVLHDFFSNLVQYLKENDYI